MIFKEIIIVIVCYFMGLWGKINKISLYVLDVNNISGSVSWVVEIYEILIYKIRNVIIRVKLICRISGCSKLILKCIYKVWWVDNFVIFVGVENVIVVKWLDFELLDLLLFNMY